MKTGIVFALASAALFGVSTPLAKVLLGAMSPWVLAGLLYAGSGAGLLLVIGVRQLVVPVRLSEALPQQREALWLVGAIAAGGIAGPVLLMSGLALTAASTASLLLNLEAVFTALLAWLLFRENFDWRIALGMVSIVAGGAVLAWSPGSATASLTGTLLVGAACLCWALDNNLTRRVSSNDALVIAATKGAVAGAINLAVATQLGESLPPARLLADAMLLGFAGYGVSLVLFVLALRNLGTARTSAYFAVGPFFGALVAIGLNGDPVTFALAGAGALMALGVLLHVMERHQHPHDHFEGSHSHAHRHDIHHAHDHEQQWRSSRRHTHRHTHAPLRHSHPHYPDTHHRHDHD
jgi:drug/metabolite transporter (DMT)-like permease